MTKSFQEIYDEFNERIHHYLGQLVGENEADDLTQEVFIKVHKGLPSFKGQSSISTWIYRIATNSGLDRLRSAWNRRISRDICLNEEMGLPATQLAEQSSLIAEREQSIPQQMIKLEMKISITMQLRTQLWKRLMIKINGSGMMKRTRWIKTAPGMWERMNQ